VALTPVVIETWYCGCCGAVAGYGDRPLLWCPRCREHVLPSDGCPLPLHLRTWYAQSGEDCPFSPIDKPW
jgi:hypothetical protein